MIRLTFDGLKRGFCGPMQENTHACTKLILLRAKDSPKKPRHQQKINAPHVQEDSTVVTAAKRWAETSSGEGYRAKGESSGKPIRREPRQKSRSVLILVFLVFSSLRNDSRLLTSSPRASLECLLLVSSQQPCLLATVSFALLAFRRDPSPASRPRSLARTERSPRQPRRSPAPALGPPSNQQVTTKQQMAVPPGRGKRRNLEEGEGPSIIRELTGSTAFLCTAVRGISMAPASGAVFPAGRRKQRLEKCHLLDVLEPEDNQQNQLRDACFLRAHL